MSLRGKLTGTRRLKESGFQNTGAGTGGREVFEMTANWKFGGKEVKDVLHEYFYFLWKVDCEVILR